MSSFREALGKHLLAIEERDLRALADTVAPDEALFVTTDGKLARSASEFLETHRGWFAMNSWRLEVKRVHIFESPQMGVALLQLEYRETRTASRRRGRKASSPWCSRTAAASG